MIRSSSDHPIMRYQSWCRTILHLGMEIWEVKEEMRI